MTVHSTQLAFGTESGGPNLRYTVPSGKRTIVKGVSAFNTDAAFNRFYLEAFTSGGTLLAIMSFTLDAFGTLGESRNEQIWQVLNAGETIKTDALHASIYFAISGAELIV